MKKGYKFKIPQRGIFLFTVNSTFIDGPSVETFSVYKEMDYKDAKKMNWKRFSEILDKEMGRKAREK